jgi:ComF family protein
LEWLILNEADLEQSSQKLDFAHVFENFYALYFFRKEMKIQKLIHQIKYNGNEALGVEFGRRLGLQIKEKNWNLDAIIPIPMHKKKEKKRGYNQANLIAQGCAEVLQIPVLNNLLFKVRNVKTQTKLNKLLRKINVENVFQISSNTTGYSYGHVLLVDDVLTTGATLTTCALKLKTELGIKKISAATLAIAN